MLIRTYAWSISKNLEWGVDIGEAQSTTCAWYQNVFIKKLNSHCKIK